MDAGDFEQVYDAFHDYFAPLFGRRGSRDHSRHLLQALLMQFGERRNAENLSETVPVSAMATERFGTDELLRWLEDTQRRNELAKRSHAKRRAAIRASPNVPPESSLNYSSGRTN